MIKGSVAAIETLGLVDGPGIRTVIFLNGCPLRCKFCHNPEMWNKQDNNTTVKELVDKIIKMKPYFKDSGGVTFSGGEPLLQSKFLTKVAKKLKKEGIHTCLDTSGVGKNYDKLLNYIDLVLLDIKHTNKEEYQNLTHHSVSDVEKFIKVLNKKNKPVWIRQVIIPNVTDNKEYLLSLNEYLKKINNIKNIEFLPYHTMGEEKYKKLNIKYQYEDKKAMDKQECEKLYQEFKEIIAIK